MYSRFRPEKLLVRCLLLWAALALLQGCRDGNALPEEPGLLSEDFGCGISIGQTMESANTKAKKGPPLTVEVLNPESLLSRNPYTADGELLLALCPQPESGELQVEEIRCYLKSDSATLSFKGSKLALTALEDAERMLGAALSKTASSDGRTHLLYHFAIKGDAKRQLRLTLSFDHLGKCSALELKREARAKK